jgi:hypothetical protein
LPLLQHSKCSREYPTAKQINNQRSQIHSGESLIKRLKKTL